MGQTTIEWVRNPDGTPGKTVNPIRFRNKETGKVGHYCEKTSAGCTNCYSSRMQKPYLSGLEFIAENRDKGELFFDEAVLHKVLRTRKPTSFFWCDMTDLFGAWVSNEWIDRCVATMAVSRQHIHYVLTKRPARMVEWSRAAYDRLEQVALPKLCGIQGMASLAHLWPLPCLRLGVSVENRPAKYRIDQLRETPAVLRFLSLEPLLEDLGELDLRGISLCIVGGESGPVARRCRVEWIESVIEQCKGAGIACFCKQLGSYAILDPRYDRSISGATRRLHHPRGGDPSEWPESLRVRQMPEVEP